MSGLNTEKDEQNEKLGNEIHITARTNLFQRLAARFGFAVVKNKETSANKRLKSTSTLKLITRPTDSQLKSKDVKGELDLVKSLVGQTKLSSSVAELFDEWADDTQNTYRNIQEREERLNALTYMCDNEGIVKAAVNLVASESSSLTDRVAFNVISEDEHWQERTNALLKDVWKYTQNTIYSLAWDIFLYGEAFQAREISSAGVVGIEAVKVNEIVERLEFKASKMAEYNLQVTGGVGGQSSGFTLNMTTPTNGSFGTSNLTFSQNMHKTSYTSTNELLKNYIENIVDVSSTEWFTPHLIGYRIYNDQLVAPWQISHFRLNADVSEFWPYGQPSLLGCLSAWKQFQRVMGLDDLATLLNMPKYMYKVKTGGATTARAIDIVSTVKERFENVGLASYSAGMEGPSLCTNIWTSDDLVTIEKTGGDGTTDGSNTDKMKFFYNRLALATGAPMTYFDPNSEGFQMSGVALQALYRPFRTLVESIRSVIIEEVEDTIRLHDSIVKVDTPDFVLTLNVENPVATEDLSARLQLADGVMDAVANLLGLSDKAELPQTVKKDVLSKYASLSVSELDNYLDTMKEEGPTKDAESEGEEGDEGFEDEGFEDEGFDEGSEDNGDFEESYRGTKRRLIEARYKAAKPEIIQYYITEQLGKLVIPKSISHFCDGFNSKRNAEYSAFLKERTSKKHGKSKLQG